jgi:Protein of unknown function (DUF3800)
MRLLYCDESNLNSRDSDFFVYGGLAIDVSAASSLSTAIERIRADAGISPEFILKFNPCPPNLQHQQFAEGQKGHYGGGGVPWLHLSDLTYFASRGDES